MALELGIIGGFIGAGILSSLPGTATRRVGRRIGKAVFTKITKAGKKIFNITKAAGKKVSNTISTRLSSKPPSTPAPKNTPTSAELTRRGVGGRRGAISKIPAGLVTPIILPKPVRPIRGIPSGSIRGSIGQI